jgi:hypothetical protein
MGTKLGLTDTKLLWVDGLGRLEEGMRRRLYSNEVAGRGPGPRRRGGAERCSRRAREAGTRGQGTIQSKPIPLHLSRQLILCLRLHNSYLNSIKLSLYL